ncbi:MAG: discoidin domain-containing protein [Desulfomonilaceae bacterium]
MTFVTEGVSSAAGEISFLIENLQLLFINQCSLHDLPLQTNVNGFADAFSNSDSIDLTLSKARYDQAERYFSEIPGETGITETIRIENGANLEMVDPTQFTVNESGLSINRVLISDGSLNTSATYATPAMSSNVFPLPAVISASSEYVSPNCPAWRAFDQNENHSTNPEECWIAVATATEVAPQWIKIDLGSGSSKIINKYAMQSRNSSDPSFISSPKNFSLLGSNDDIGWVTLDTVQEFPELASNTWSSYRTFDNNVAYRFYKLEITASHGTGLTSLSQLKLTEASYKVPLQPEIAILPGFSTAGWLGVTNISPDFSTPGSSKIFYALSFDKGTDSEQWQIWNGVKWKTVAQIFTGTWKYVDNSGDIVDSPVNTRVDTLKLALGLEANQMDSQTLSSINENFSQVFVSGDIALAIGMAGDDTPQVPSFTGLSISHDQRGLGLDLIIRPCGSSKLVSRVSIGFIGKNIGPETRLFLGMGADTPSWVELTSYSLKTTLASGVDYVSASLTNPEPVFGPFQLRITAPAGTGTEIHGWALNWND